MFPDSCKWKKAPVVEQREQIFIPIRVQKFRKKGYGFTNGSVKGTIKAFQRS